MLSTYEMRKNSVKLHITSRNNFANPNCTSVTAEAETHEKLDEKTCQTTMQWVSAKSDNSFSPPLYESAFRFRNCVNIPSKP